VTYQAGDNQQMCAGAGVSEHTVAGVLTIFEHGNGAGVDFSEGRSRSQFFNKRLLCLLLIYYLNPFVLMKGYFVYY